MALVRTFHLPSTVMIYNTYVTPPLYIIRALRAFTRAL